MAISNEDRELITKLDAAIDKLYEVSADIKAAIAVHEQKFDNQEQLNQTFYDQIEKLHLRIGDLRDENTKQHDAMFKNLDKRLQRIERWRWIVIGMAMFAGFMLSTNVVDWIQ